MFPFLLLLFSDPKRTGAVGLDLYVKCLTAIAIVNDVIGLIQFANNPSSDDSFMGIYSEYSISGGGLAILNTILAFYYFISFVHIKSPVRLFLSAFLFVCGILGFYGAGLVACTVAFIFSFFTLRITTIVKTFIITIASITALYFVVLFAKPNVIDYNIANIKKILSFDIQNGPRKLTSFYNYGISYVKDPKDFLLGSGPGTFNSRSAFMVGSPSYFSSVKFIKDADQPYYFKNFAYTLWNESNTIQSQYLDGFRNQPFSSLLAFLGEYGVIFFVAFVALYTSYYRRVAKIYRHLKGDPSVEIHFRYFKFLVLLLPVLLLIDNFYEFPEIMLLLILGIKLAHAGIHNAFISSAQKEPHLSL
jgi:hypothetical protein